MVESLEKTRRLGKAVATLADSSGRVLVCEALCHLDFQRLSHIAGFHVVASALWRVW